MNLFITGKAFFGKTCDYGPLITALEWKDVQIVPYDSDIVSKIKSAPSNEPIIIVSHSFGSESAVLAVSKFIRPIEKLLLLDPIHFNWAFWNDFKIPPNVKAALCIKKGFGLPPSSRIKEPPMKGIWVENRTYGNMFSHGTYPSLPEVIEKSVEFLKS